MTVKTMLIQGFKPKSKARPRFNGRNGTAYMPEDYMRWRSYVEVQIRGQWHDKPVKTQYVILFFDVLDHRSDADNLAGSILDCMVAANKIIEANPIANDTLEHVPNLMIFSRKVKRDPKVYITMIYDDKDADLKLMIYLVKMLFNNPMIFLEKIRSYFLPTAEIKV